jgi:Flp pilus assembly protein TadG
MVNLRCLIRPVVGGRLSDDTGSAGMSTFVVVMTFIMLLGLGVAGMRTFIGASDLQAAGQAGARAAALEHDLGDATAAAQQVVDDELARRLRAGGISGG